MFSADCFAICRLAKQAGHSIAVPSSPCAPCALKPAARPKPATKPGTGCAVATNTSNNLNNTAASPYADSEAQKRMDVPIVEHHLRPERMATDRLTRATNALAWTTGVLGIATIALVPATLSS
jgi:hypothetical protein